MKIKIKHTKGSYDFTVVDYPHGNVREDFNILFGYYPTDCMGDGTTTTFVLDREWTPTDQANFQTMLDVHVPVNDNWDRAEHERIWRDAVLLSTDRPLLRLMEEGDDITDLKNFRTQLRDWPAHKDFTDKAKRPKLKGKK